MTKLTHQVNICSICNDIVYHAGISSDCIDLRNSPALLENNCINWRGFCSYAGILNFITALWQNLCIIHRKNAVILPGC